MSNTELQDNESEKIVFEKTEINAAELKKPNDVTLEIPQKIQKEIPEILEIEIPFSFKYVEEEEETNAVHNNSTIYTTSYSTDVDTSFKPAERTSTINKNPIKEGGEQSYSNYLSPKTTLFSVTEKSDPTVEGNQLSLKTALHKYQNTRYDAYKLELTQTNSTQPKPAILEASIEFIDSIEVVPVPPQPEPLQTPPSGFSTGNTYFVSPDGNDATGNGSFENPFATINYAVYNVQAGDTLYIRGGTYTPEYEMRVRSDYDNKTYGGDPNIDMNAESGTSTAPVTFAGYPGEDVVIDLQNVDAFLHLDGKEYWTWQDMSFVNSKIAFNVGQNSRSEHNTFKNMSFEANRGGDNEAVITLKNKNAEHTQILGNDIVGPGSDVHANTGGIWLTHVDNVTIIGNEISNVPIGIYYKHANTGNAHTVNSQIAYNYIYDTYRNSMDTNQSHAHLHDNLFGSGGNISVNEANGAPGGDYNLIENNTFFGASLVLNGSTQAGDTTPGAIGNVLQNNIFTYSLNAHNYSSTPHNTTSDYNLFRLYPDGSPPSYTESAIAEDGEFYNLSNWQAHSGQDLNSLEGLPGFIGEDNPANLSEFKLANTSIGHNASSDGNDIGANIDALQAALDSFIIGNAHDNTLTSTDGLDMLYGQAGADVFIINALNLEGGYDTILDFKTGEGDQLDISEILSGYDPVSDAISDFVLTRSVGDDTILSIDNSGSGNVIGSIDFALLIDVSNFDSAQALNDNALVV